MRNKLIDSIQRAQTLLGTMKTPSDFIVIKLRPEPSCCCCTSHWPEAWSDVNRRIAPAGPVPHEGDALIEVDRERFIIEGHESGPEFIALLAVVSGSITVLRTIIDLVTLFVRKRRRSRGSGLIRLHLEVRRIHDDDLSEHVLTFELFESHDLKTVLEKKLKDMLTEV